MNLVTFKFCVLFGGCEANAAPSRIDDFGQLKALAERVPKELPHHQDHVFVGMVIVIPKHDMVTGLPLPLFVFLLFRGGDLGRFSDQC